ncbi:MAG: NapC/NirT family cytochrome c [Bryobacteraceae bacterium]|nr:NapC/NirT family cytochrome c [Bryobacteraceae bacterium]
MTTSAFCWLVLAPRELGNPYTGIVTFVVLPLLFFAGLILIPAGVWLAKRRIGHDLAAMPDRRGAIKRLAIFFAATTLVNLVFATQVTYHAVEHMEGVGFCGQSCHVMQPQFRAYQAATHNQVACVECHVAPGASGWLQAKAAGTRQLIETVSNSYPRPIPSGTESEKLIESSKTCEGCHSRARIAATRVRVRASYAQDEGNTVTYTVLTARVGGVGAGGIHGAHLDPEIDIRYRATGANRQTIPYVVWRNRRTNEVHEYRSDAGVSASQAGEATPMQCTDCHNRPAHSFERAGRAVDDALASGAISRSLPYVKKNALALLTGVYPSQAAADQAIRSDFRTRYPSREDAEAAAAAVSAIYARNVFPDLKVTWDTYPDNRGHTDFPGCFRCHDGQHVTKSGRAIGQDCSSCHDLLAVEEANPEVLDKLNPTWRKQ